EPEGADDGDERPPDAAGSARGAGCAGGVTHVGSPLGKRGGCGGEWPWETGPEPRPGREWGTDSAPESALRLPSMCSAPPRASRGVTEKVLVAGASSGPERREWGQARRRGPCTRPGSGLSRRRARACFRAGAPSTACPLRVGREAGGGAVRLAGWEGYGREADDSGRRRIPGAA